MKNFFYQAILILWGYFFVNSAIAIEKKYSGKGDLYLSKKMISDYFEIKGTGQLVSEWFEAEQNSDGVFVLTKKGKRDMETKKQQTLDSSNSSGSGSGGSS